MKKTRILLILLCLPFWLAAQTVLTGSVSDTEGGALAFVAVIPNDDVSKAVLSDIEGQFKISVNAPIKSLSFRLVGMETRRLLAEDLARLGKQPLRIVLQSADQSLAEFIFVAGENPAHRIVRLAIDHKDQNNPEKLKTFYCHTYNKLAFNALPNDSLYRIFISKKDTTKKIWRKNIQDFKRADSLTKIQDAFFMETVTERRFRYPNDNFEKVLLNRVAGFPSAGVLSLANMIQPFSFYADFIRVLDKNYVNPISKGSPNLYFFNIEDTLYNGLDTVFILSYHPRKGRVFEGLTGVVHINSKNWAVQNVKARPNNAAASTIKIEQQYAYHETAKQWFPEQLNFEWVFEKYPNPFMGMHLSGRSYITDVSVNPVLKQSDFNPETPLVIAENALNRPDSAWSKYRTIAPLSIRNQLTYKHLDSLVKKKNLNQWAKGLQILATGKLPVASGISLDLPRLIRLNEYENIRLGLGFTTAEYRPLYLPKRLELSAYFGYGVQDAAFKYGASVKYRLHRGNETNLQISYANDLAEPGAPADWETGSLVGRSLYANRLDKNEEYAAVFGTRFLKRFFMRLSLKNQQIRPTYPYQFVNSDGSKAQNFHFTEGGIYARFVFNEQNNSLTNMNELNRLPVIEFSFIKGLSPETPILSIGIPFLESGDYRYQKWLFAVHQMVLIRRLGRMAWRLEAGQVRGQVPFAKLFTLNQGGAGGFSFVAVDNTFQALNDSSSWLSDRFLNIYFRQEIGHILYRVKWSQPILSLVQNMAWGDLKNPEAHLDLPFKIASRPFLESGLILDNLLLINYLNFSNFGFGMGAYYRWGFQSSSDWRKNWAFRLSMRMAL
jgi:hypothetical protein